MSVAVVFTRIFGKSFFSPSSSFEFIITLVDYTEIPAIITTSLVYLNEIRKTNFIKNLWFLIFINSQWLHLLWITDEFVIEHFTNHNGPSIIPIWLAWVAILIDYLEIPVIFDTLKKFYKALKNDGVKPAFEELKD